VIDDTQAPRYPKYIYYEGLGSNYRLCGISEEMAVRGNYSVADLYKYQIFDDSAGKSITWEKPMPGAILMWTWT
jgi:hypothetical protein